MITCKEYEEIQQPINVSLHPYSDLPTVTDTSSEIINIILLKEYYI